MANDWFIAIASSVITLVIKSFLDDKNTRYKIAFEKLHTERALVIKETYKRLVSVGDDFELYGITRQPRDLQNSLETLRLFADYYNEHRIFFAETDAVSLDLLRDYCLKSYSQFRTSEVQEAQKDFASATDRYVKTLENFQKEFPTLRKKIEIEFRQMIGIE